jgi:CubicO group peptidase (beta-lactamase class C family)
MHPLRRTLTAVVFVLALTAAANSEQQPNPDLARFQSELEHLRQTLLVPGLSVAIVKDKKILWAGGLGYRDEAARLPATGNTRYPIASLTKCFTAVAAMQLVGRKRLNLDDPASKYGDRSAERLRVRHYLSQMSESAPGVRFLYNSERFNRLGAILEKASGKPLRSLFEEQIFRPADMTNTTGGVPDNPALRTEIAAGYDVSANGAMMKAAFRPEPLEAASGIVSTVLDLAKFDIALDANKILKPDLKFEMWTPSLSELGPTPYGLGWFVENRRGDDLIWHYGQLADYSALYLKIPQKHVTLILLANSSTLSSPFPLQFGQVLFSPIATAFLRDFVFESATEPKWDAVPDALNAQLTELEKSTPAYSYEYELASQAFIAAWRGEKARAATLFRLALHRYPDLLSRTNNPAFLYEFARLDDPALQKLGERIGAALLTADPGNPRTRFDLAVLLVREKHCPEAVPLLEKVLARDDAFMPIRAWSGYMLAECVAEKNPREAESVLHRVIQLNNNADGVLDDAQVFLNRLRAHAETH